MNAAHLIAADAARRYEAVPIGYLDERTLLLATADPGNIVAFDDITMKTGLDVRPVVASREDLGDADRQALAPGRRRSRPRPRPRTTSVTAVDLRDADDEAPIIKLVHAIIAEAVELGASDIHFAPEGDGTAGLLPHRRRARAARASCRETMARGVVSRIKIMANLDISERRVPQDGRLALTVAGRPVDVRVVTLPLVAGESVVMRILDHGGGVIELDALGLRDGELEQAAPRDRPARTARSS